jgi:acetaldehyde dehydrogenase/alcohol dehydrogenase
MQAIQLVFKYLPIAYEHPGDEEARSMMHNVARITALAFSNASVGVNHALAHVIAYNASIPVKFMPSPNQKGYLAHKKYAAMADLLGLGGYTIDEKVKKLVTAIEQLLDRLGMPRSIAQLGISREEFERAMPDLARLAYDDPSWRSNPRMPLVGELVELLWSAYEGRGAVKAASAPRQAVEDEVCV